MAQATAAATDPGISPAPPPAAASPARRRHDPVWRFMALLLVVFVAKQVFATFAFPAFSGHDEVAHMAYLQVLAEERRIPLIPDLEEWRATRLELRGQLDDDQDEALLPGDDVPDAFYPWCRYVLDWYCEPESPRWGPSPPRVVSVTGEYFPSGWLYTANHPPLYYVLMTPVHLLAKAAGLDLAGEQYALRLAGVPIGAAVVLLAFLTARAIFPDDRFLQIGAPAFVAFQPQISYEGALVNNDGLSIALFALLLYLLVRGLRDGFTVRKAAWIGVVLGLGLLTKSSLVAGAPIIALAIVLGVGWRNVRQWVTLGAAAVIPAAVLAAPWYLFMMRRYGNLDGFDQIAALQGWWNKPMGSFFGLLFDPRFALDRFHETWGQYGWRMIPLGAGTLTAIGIGSVICVAGLYLYATLAARGLGAPGDPVEHPERWQRHALLVLFAACVVAWLAVIQFGTRFALSQARYFFPVATAAAVLTTLGLRTAIPPRWRGWGPAALVAAMLVLNVWLFVAYVLPFRHSQLVDMPWLDRGRPPALVEPATERLRDGS